MNYVRTFHVLSISLLWPGGDGDTPQQAASLFKATGAKNLLITGRKWTASVLPFDCASSSQGGQRYYMTDTTHSVVRMKWKSRNQGINIFHQREPFFNGALPHLVLSFKCMGKREQHALRNKYLCPLVLVSRTVQAAFSSSDSIVHFLACRT